MAVGTKRLSRLIRPNVPDRRRHFGRRLSSSFPRARSFFHQSAAKADCCRETTLLIPPAPLLLLILLLQLPAPAPAPAPGPGPAPPAPSPAPAPAAALAPLFLLSRFLFLIFFLIFLPPTTSSSFFIPLPPPLSLSSSFFIPSLPPPSSSSFFNPFLSSLPPAVSYEAKRRDSDREMSFRGLYVVVCRLAAHAAPLGLCRFGREKFCVFLCSKNGAAIISCSKHQNTAFQM